MVQVAFVVVHIVPHFVFFCGLHRAPLAHRVALATHVAMFWLVLSLSFGAARARSAGNLPAGSVPRPKLLHEVSGAERRGEERSEAHVPALSGE